MANLGGFVGLDGLIIMVVMVVMYGLPIIGIILLIRHLQLISKRLSG